MTIILLVFALVCLWNTKIVSHNEQYISRQTTVQLNGIFVFLVLCSHFMGYVDVEFPYSKLYMEIQSFLAQLVVTTFLFYSGYGVFYSIMKKQEQYVMQIPKKIVELVLMFSSAICLFVILGWYLGKRYTLGNVVASCFGWSSIGNSNWYLFVIVLLYALTFFCYQISKKPMKFLVIFFICSLMAMAFLYEFQRGSRWYNTFLCYFFGMVYAYQQKRWEQYVLAKPWVQGIVFVLFLGCFFYAHSVRTSILFYIIHTGLFVMLITMLSYHVRLHNPILRWIGSHIFGIYILQRIPMRLFSEFDLIANQPFLYFMLSCICCFILAHYFDLFCKKVIHKVVCE